MNKFTKKVVAVAIALVFTFIMALVSINSFNVVAASNGQPYISEIKVIGRKKSKNTITDLQKQGYSVIDYDLNKGAGGLYIYLGYKTTSNYNDAIKDIIVVTGSNYNSNNKNTLNISSRSYNRCAYMGDSSFNDSRGDLNKGAGGAYVYLYYTKEGNNSYSAVSDLYVDNNKGNAVSDTDLNKGTIRGKSIYLHISKKVDRNAKRNSAKYVNGSNWMSYLSDDIKITDLNIPGAHDAACVEIDYMPFQAIGETQSYHIYKHSYAKNHDTVTEDGLLEHGVRYFDIRYAVQSSKLKVNSVNDEQTVASSHLKVIHNEIAGIDINCGYVTSINRFGIKSTSTLTNDVLMGWFKSFLEENPDETIILDASTDNTGKDKEKCNEWIVKFFKNQAQNRNPKYPEIYVGNHVPTLKECRGKLVVISNADNGKNWYKLDNSSVCWGFSSGNTTPKDYSFGGNLWNYATMHSVFKSGIYTNLSNLTQNLVNVKKDKSVTNEVTNKWMWVKTGFETAEKVQREDKIKTGKDAFMLNGVSANENNEKHLDFKHGPVYFATHLNPMVSLF